MICEDYALHGEGVASISDGCSTAVDTDWGSRLLCKAGINNPTNIDAVLQKATDAAKVLDLGPESLFATYGYVYECSEEYVAASLWGDGSIVYLDDDNNWVKWTIDYQDNTPSYPIYRNLPLINHDKQKTVRTDEKLCHQIGLPCLIPNERYDVRLPKESLKALYVFSDGIDSFIDVNTKRPISNEQYFDMLHELIQIKMRGPGVIKRRCNKFFNVYCRKNNIINSDDFSVGAWINEGN